MKTKTSSAAALSSRFSPVVVRPRAALLPVASPLLCVCTQKKERKKERKKKKMMRRRRFFSSHFMYSLFCVFISKTPLIEQQQYL